MMAHQHQLVADIMADLTGRFGDLTQASVQQHLPANIDREHIEAMIGEIRDTLTLAEAAAIMARPSRFDDEGR